MNSAEKGLIICGTDTDVGKTVVSALIVQGLSATYWKPIQSGLEDGGDKGRIRQLINLPSQRYIEEAYKFKAPVSPHWAAEKESQIINPDSLKIPKTDNFLVIETAGGVMVPLTRNYLQIEQIKKWDFPVVLVTRTSLGTLNHTLLTLEAMKKRKIKILGLFLNGPNHEDNPKTLEQFGQVPVIGHLPILPNVTAGNLSQQWKTQKLFDVFSSLLQFTN
tara:strand:+ start:793 stop:1449 length:657 start_codon:yes stop_codon:yes gene_type:complete